MFKISSKTAIHMERSQDRAYKMTNIDDIFGCICGSCNGIQGEYS